MRGWRISYPVKPWRGGRQRAEQFVFRIHVNRGERPLCLLDPLERLAIYPLRQHEGRLRQFALLAEVLLSGRLQDRRHILQCPCGPGRKQETRRRAILQPRVALNRDLKTQIAQWAIEGHNSSRDSALFLAERRRVDDFAGKTLPQTHSIRLCSRPDN